MQSCNNGMQVQYPTVILYVCISHLSQLSMICAIQYIFDKAIQYYIRNKSA